MPSMSSTTSTCPSHDADAPMPITGQDRLAAIDAASGSTTPSTTTAKAPAAAMASASAAILACSAWPRPRAVAAQDVHRLRRQAHMSHHGDAARRQEGDRGGHGLAAFQLDGGRAGFLQHAGGRREGLLGTGFVAAERHVHHHQRGARAARHGRAVRDHGVQRDGDGGWQSVDGLRQAVAHQQRVAAGIQQLGHARRVRGQHDQRFLALAGAEGGHGHAAGAGALAFRVAVVDMRASCSGCAAGLAGSAASRA